MKKTNQQIAVEVLMGKWGNGAERFQALKDAGYDPSTIQTIVNYLVKDGAPTEEVKTEIKLGTENMEIEIDLAKYNSITLNFTYGDSNE